MFPSGKKIVSVDVTQPSAGHEAKLWTLLKIQKTNE